MKKRSKLLLLLALVLGGVLLLGSVPSLAGGNSGHAESLTEIRQALSEQLMSEPGFVGIAHSEERGEVVIFVENEQAKRIVSNRFGSSPVRIEVTGRIEALSTQLAEPMIPSQLSHVSVARTRKVRPLVGGISVSADVTWEGWAGTLGMVTYDNKILSNAHVIAMDLENNFLPEGTPIVQPGSGDALLRSRVGALQAYITIDFGPDAENYADVAIGSIDSSVAVSPGWQFHEGGNYRVEGWTEVSVSDTVRKSGRTSGVTTSEVLYTNAEIWVSYGDQSACFVDQIVVKQPFSQQGDSGSVMDKDGEFVGLVFAGSDDYSIVCKASYILDELGIVVEPPLGIITAQLPAGQVGVAYEETLEAIGGTSPYTWAIIEGDLPDGLDFDHGTGVVWGTPTEVGTFNFTVQVTDTENSTATRDLSVTVVRTLTYNLTISSTAGGSVTVPGEDTFPYEEGTVVNLVAEHDEGYQFVNWLGEVDSIDDVNAASTIITMHDDYSITANFVSEAPATRFLKISSTEGGSVTIPGEGSFAYEEGTTVALAAEPDESYRFVHWAGDVDTIGDVDAAETTIILNCDKTIAAHFEMRSPFCRVSFTVDRTEAEVGETVIFTNETSGGTPPYLAARWDFDGDGVVDSTAANQTGQTVVWVYTSPGTYSVTLTIFDIDGTHTETKHGYVTVYPEILPSEPGLGAGFESIANELIVAYYYAGFGVWDVYWPDLDIDTIGALEVGEIYQIYVESDCTLEYGTHSYELNGPDWNFVYWLPQ